MLVLTRKLGQSLQVGDNITVTVLEVRGRVIRLGIEAPRDVRVLRGELDDWQAHDKTIVGRKVCTMAAAG